MARAGDAEAAALCEETATLIGIAVGNVVAALDPEVVVFGGGLSREGESLLGRVREVVYRMVPVRPEIVVSTLGDDAQLHGAVRAALEAAGLGASRTAGGRAARGSTGSPRAEPKNRSS